jgi:hypothetical protein
MNARRDDDDDDDDRATSARVSSSSSAFAMRDIVVAPYVMTRRRASCDAVTGLVLCPSRERDSRRRLATTTIAHHVVLCD